MKSRHKNIVIIILLTALSIIPFAFSEPKTEVVLRAADHGYLTHIEYEPEPRYQHLSLTASEVAKELLVKAFSGEDLDQKLLNFLLRCYRNGYFTSDPASSEADFEATFYSIWFFHEIGVEKAVNETILEEALLNAEEFTTAFYVARTLKLLGYQIKEPCLEAWNLGYAVSYIKNSTAPDVESTKLWLLLFPDDTAKREWLRDRGIYVYPEASVESLVKDWFGIEQLILYKPVFVNATIFPRIVVNQEPRLVSVRAVKFPNEPVEVFFNWSIEDDTIVSRVYAGGRIINFTHIVGRQEYAILTIMQMPGYLTISCSYKPQYRLRLFIAGIKYEWIVNSYDFNKTIELPAYGVFNLEAEIEREDVLLRGKGTINLKTSYEAKLLDYALIILPTVSVITGLAGVYNKKKKGLLAGSFIAAQIPLLNPDFLMGIHPLWITLGYGALLLALTYIIEREAFYRCLSHIVILTALTSTAMIMGNPLILLLGGFGAGLFLASAIIYPSERDKTERFYKSTMLIYSLGVLAMALLNEASISLATMLYAPDSGFIDAIRVQAMFIANIFALTPVVAPLYHLARLIHVYERAREAEDILKKLSM